MILHTSRIWLADPDGLDISIQGKDPFGKLFAPTWKMVMDYKKDNHGHMSRDVYTAEYHDKMYALYEERPEVWLELLNRARVVLKCYCRSGDLCHRLLLVEYLRKVAAHHGISFRYDGELT